jgi:hypothetical protein
LSDLIIIIAVLLIIKIGLDIRDRRLAHRHINQRFDRLHKHLDATDHRLERQLKFQARSMTRMGDRLERIESVFTAPYRDDY